MNSENLNKYKIFLKSIDNDTSVIFEHQKEYLYCKKGCSKCCEKGDYPMSQIEFDYMMQGFLSSEESIKNQITDKVKLIKDNESDSYECPFLIKNECSIYEYRPLVCRVFGVLTEDANNNPAYPFCMLDGLNYSNIYDKEKGHMSMELVIKKGYKNFPKFFKLSNAVIMNLPYAKELGIEFGKTDKMINFF